MWLKSIFYRIRKSNYFKLFAVTNIFILVGGSIWLYAIYRTGYQRENVTLMIHTISRLACTLIFGWGLFNSIIGKYNDDFKQLIIGIIQMIQGGTSIFFYPLWLFVVPSTFLLLILDEILSYFLFWIQLIISHSWHHRYAIGHQ